MSSPATASVRLSVQIVDPWMMVVVDVVGPRQKKGSLGSEYRSAAAAADERPASILSRKLYSERHKRNKRWCMKQNKRTRKKKSSADRPRLITRFCAKYVYFQSSVPYWLCHRFITYFCHIFVYLCRAIGLRHQYAVCALAA